MQIDIDKVTFFTQAVSVQTCRLGDALPRKYICWNKTVSGVYINLSNTQTNMDMVTKMPNNGNFCINMQVVVTT